MNSSVYWCTACEAGSDSAVNTALIEAKLKDWRDRVAGVEFFAFPTRAEKPGTTCHSTPFTASFTGEQGSEGYN